jgi:hypothetical protein
MDQKSRQITTSNLLVALLDREEHDPVSALLEELKVDKTTVRARLR